MQEDTDVEDGENEAQDSDDSEQIIAGGIPHFVLSWQNMFFVSQNHQYFALQNILQMHQQVQRQVIPPKP